MVLARFTIQTDSADATRRLGAVLGALVRPGDVLLLSGDLGAGKTQLVKGLAEALGVRGPVTSPTFNILLVHEGHIPLYHIDLYRLERAEQLEDIDYFGALEAGGVAAVEWGDRFEETRPSDHVSIALRIHGDTERQFDIEGVGERSDELVRALASPAQQLEGVHRIEEPR